MVRNGTLVAWGIARRALFRGCLFYRALWARAGRGVSFGACGGIVRGSVGRMAAPALVVLGVAAPGAVHVCFDGVGAVSLRSGYFGRDGHGDAGICDREVGYEEAGRDLRSRIEIRKSIVASPS